MGQKRNTRGVGDLRYFASNGIGPANDRGTILAFCIYAKPARNNNLQKKSLMSEGPNRDVNRSDVGAVAPEE